MSDESRAVERWKAETDAIDRIYSVVSTVDQPQTVAYIAEEAHVSENTARKHLKWLDEQYIAEAHEGEGAIRYAPNPRYQRMKTVGRYVDEHTHEELIEKKAELQDQIARWQDEFEVDSPEALRRTAAETRTVEETRTVKKTASDWELLRYRLNAVEHAIESYNENSC